MISGEKVFLRAVESDDLPQLMKWRNLPFFRKYFREYREISSAMQKQWYEKIVIGNQNTVMYSICDIKDDKLVGCTGLCYINWIHGNADFSLYIGEKEQYIDEDGMADETCRLVLDYGFHTLNLHKIWSEIYEFDDKKQRLYDRNGLHRDGIFRDHCYYNGRWWDSHFYSILKNEFV